MSDKEKRVIAYHEGGHALVGHVLPNTDPIHKVSIIARGRALGWTLALPERGQVPHDPIGAARRAGDAARWAHGRGADLRDPTTGAQNDIERATQIARAMVTEFGMSDAIGPQQLGAEERRGLPRPRLRAPDRTTPKRWRPTSTPRCVVSSTRPTTRRPRSSSPIGPRSTSWPTPSSRRRRSTRRGHGDPRRGVEDRAPRSEGADTGNGRRGCAR